MPRKPKNSLPQLDAADLQRFKMSGEQLDRVVRDFWAKLGGTEREIRRMDGTSVFVSAGSTLVDLVGARDGDSDGGRGRQDTPAGAGAGATTTEPAGGAEAPLGNTGDTREFIRLVATGTGECLEIPIRRGWGGSAAFIDWVNFTFHQDTAHLYADLLVEDDDYVLAVSRRLEEIFGFGVTAKRKGGLHFFQQAYDLGDKWGLVLIGGQRGRMMVSLSGEGCCAAAPGWEKRLHDWLIGEAVDWKLTRVDCAYDDLYGERYSVDQADADDDSGLFINPRAPEAPHTEKVGPWKRNQQKGRTFTVGRRSSDKFLRYYERGKKLGDETSEWLRIEGEFKAKQTVLPADILLEPGAYLAAMYPALNWLSEEQKRPVAVEKATKITFDAAQEWFKTQCGHYLDMFIHVYGVDEALSRLRRDAIPRRLMIPNHTLSPAPLRLDDKHQGLTAGEIMTLDLLGALPKSQVGAASYKNHPAICPARSLVDRVRAERRSGAGQPGLHA